MLDAPSVVSVGLSGGNVVLEPLAVTDAMGCLLATWPPGQNRAA